MADTLGCDSSMGAQSIFHVDIQKKYDDEILYILRGDFPSMTCPYCKETILDGAIKCRFCGSMLNADPAPDNITTDEIRTFIGSNSHYYLQQFSKFNLTGTEKLCMTWNWSCFGFTFLWMLYRKMYLLAVLTFIVFCIPGVNILLHIVAGVVGNYLYYGHVKQKILEIRAIPSQQNMNLVFQEVGGVHRWVITAGIVLGLIITILIGMFFSTMIAFMGYHMDKLTI
ncbi:MAG: DUF2628 domain-containing protein [Desulfuromonadales bacterium]|nr:DUF2628 domain-containing protein [Desulfuromonadales bacterium]